MHLPRTTVLIAASFPVVAGAALITTSTFANAEGAAFPAHYAAPYLQISDSDAGDMAADLAASRHHFYPPAFLPPPSGCTPEWEDGGDAVGAFTTQIHTLQNAGGNVAISFGGAEGGELAQTWPNT